jgi:hypothetical protein
MSKIERNAMTDNTQYQDNEGELDVPEQPLAQDYDTPAAAPDDVSADKNVPQDHPRTDTDVDQHEAYDAGTATAAGMEDQREDSIEDEERIA